MNRPTSAPDGLDRLRKAKKALASFDAGMTETRGAFCIREVRVGVSPVFEGELSPQAADAVAHAVRRLIEQQLDTILVSARGRDRDGEAGRPR
jgi:hypothetical protein